MIHEYFNAKAVRKFLRREVVFHLPNYDDISELGEHFLTMDVYFILGKYIYLHLKIIATKMMKQQQNWEVLIP